MLDGISVRSGACSPFYKGGVQWRGCVWRANRLSVITFIEEDDGSSGSIVRFWTRLGK